MESRFIRIVLVKRKGNLGIFKVLLVVRLDTFLLSVILSRAIIFPTVSLLNNLKTQTYLWSNWCFMIFASGCLKKILLLSMLNSRKNINWKLNQYHYKKLKTWRSIRLPNLKETKMKKATLCKKRNKITWNLSSKVSTKTLKKILLRLFPSNLQKIRLNR